MNLKHSRVNENIGGGDGGAGSGVDMMMMLMKSVQLGVRLKRAV